MIHEKILRWESGKEIRELINILIDLEVKGAEFVELIEEDETFDLNTEDGSFDTFKVGKLKIY